MLAALLAAAFLSQSLLPSGLIDELCSTEFMPHGHCYMWLPEILWLHVGSDALVAMSYFTIPICLVVLVRKKKGLKFRGAFWLFSLFILFCGLTHLLEIYSVWHGAYRLTGLVKLATGLASLTTAVYLVRMVPTLSKLPLRQEFQAVETRLSEQEVLFEAILSGGMEAFVTVEPIQIEEAVGYDFLLGDFNEIAAREMRSNGLEARGQSIGAVFSFADAVGLAEMLAGSLETGAAHHSEIAFDDENGAPRWISFKIVPAGSRLAVFFMDTTKDRLSEKQIQQDLEDRVSTILNQRDANEARAQAAMSAATHGILVVDGKGLIVQCNTQLLQFFGYEEVELIGRSVESLVPQSARSRHVGHMDHYQAHPSRRPMGETMQSLSGLRKDGTTFPVEIGLNPFETPEGKFVCASVLDISERLQAQADLEASELRLQQATNGGNVGIWHWSDVTRDEQFWSSKMYELIGYEPHEIESTFESFKNLLHPDDLKATLLAVKNSFGDGSVFERDYRLLTKNNGYRWFYAAGTLSRDKRTGKTLLVGSIQDIQRRKDHEAEIKEVNEILESKNKEMEEMTYAVSHDLKAPLISIQGLANLLLVGGYSLSDETRGILERVDKSAKHMQLMINDMLKMSRVGSSKEEFENVDTGQLAAEVREIFEGEIKSRQCEVRLAAELPSVWASKSLLRQALQNLVANALKYGCSNEDPSIEVYSRSGRDTLDIVVQDNGRGIPENSHSSVFKLFHRLDSNAEGSGIGLAIVSKIMANLDGTAFVEKHDGTGARFVLRFKSAKKPASGVAQPNSGDRADESRGSTLVPEKDMATLPTQLTEIDLNAHFKKFVYATAHDFNAPLVTIKGHLDFLKQYGSESLSPDCQELLSQSSRAASRMSQYLEALVKYAEVLLSKDRIGIAMVEVGDLLDEIVAAREGTGTIDKVSVHFSGMPRIGCLNEGLLRTLFECLLDNAVKFTVGVEAPEVRIEVRETDTHWAFSMQDNGPGMAESETLSAFAPFGRLGVQDVDRAGFGLATCKMIVEMHSGQIWIDPDYKKGVKIHFTMSKVASER